MPVLRRFPSLVQLGTAPRVLDVGASRSLAICLLSALKANGERHLPVLGGLRPLDPAQPYPNCSLAHLRARGRPHWHPTSEHGAGVALADASHPLCDAVWPQLPGTVPSLCTRGHVDLCLRASCKHPEPKGSGEADPLAEAVPATSPSAGFPVQGA